MQHVYCMFLQVVSFIFSLYVVKKRFVKAEVLLWFSADICKCVVRNLLPALNRYKCVIWKRFICTDRQLSGVSRQVR